MISLSDYKISPISSHFVEAIVKSDYVRTNIHHGQVVIEHVHDTRMREELDKLASIRRHNNLVTTKEALKDKVNHVVESVKQTAHGLHELLHHNSYGIISANVNSESEADRGLSHGDVFNRDLDLQMALNNLGHNVTKVKGVWKDETGNLMHETAYLVEGISKNEIVALGEKYNQSSVIYGNKGKHEYIYTTGANKGKSHKGNTISEETKDSDAYTEVDVLPSPDMSGTYKFTINLDFEKLHEQ